MTVHLIWHGLPLCKFTTEQPGKWPLGHSWVGLNEYQKDEHVDCKGCLISAEQGEFDGRPIQGTLRVKPEHQPSHSIHCYEGPLPAGHALATESEVLEQLGQDQPISLLTCGFCGEQHEHDVLPCPHLKFPLPMLIFCPECGKQHVDKSNPEIGWANPPHRSHKCQRCGHVWRHADFPTTGVESIETVGKNDSPAPIRSMSFDLARMFDPALADVVIARLNVLIDDPAVRADVDKLIETRIEVSDATADHPSIQVGRDSLDGPPLLGFLGLLNGLVGTIPEGTHPLAGYGYIAGVWNEGKLVRFERTEKIAETDLPERGIGGTDDTPTVKR